MNRTSSYVMFLGWDSPSSTIKVFSTSRMHAYKNDTQVYYFDSLINPNHPTLLSSCYLQNYLCQRKLQLFFNRNPILALTKIKQFFFTDLMLVLTRTWLACLNQNLSFFVFSARVGHGAGLLTRVIRRYPSLSSRYDDIDERRRDFQADPWGKR